MDALLSSTYFPVFTAVIAAGIAWLLAAMRSNQRRLQDDLQIKQLQDKLDEKQRQCEQLDDELAEYRERLFNNQAQLGELSQKAALLAPLRDEISELKLQCREEQRTNAALTAQLQSQQAQFDEASKASTEKLALMEAAEQRLQAQFENLANRIFEQKSERFTQINQTGMNALLEPLKQQIDTFRKQMGEQHSREGQERASLKTEILTLKELNKRITEEAAALTKALKGDNKQQGNWGEVVLERILKESGLREGHEFETQVSAKDANGKLQQPDVVVHLPNEKDVIIDSKVSLRAYEQFFNCGDEVLRARFLTEHVNSLKSHIKGLGNKRYQDLKSLRTLDYVLMFIPVEPAFLLAVQEDPSLVSLALDNNILLVSPTNLLVALRTINNIWQYEYQHQNAQHIAEHAGKLYDKFVGFTGDLEKIGKSVESTQKAYESAMNKLTEGRGNLVRQVEYFRELGVQPQKKLSAGLMVDGENE